MTFPEVLLWQTLRKRPGGLKFRRQHPAGPFILDFVCLQARLAVEVDGGSHNDPERAALDLARDEWLMNQGYRTCRIPADHVIHDVGTVVAYILGQCQPLHRPSGGPPPRSGEDL